MFIRIGKGDGMRKEPLIIAIHAQVARTASIFVTRRCSIVVCRQEYRSSTAFVIAEQPAMTHGAGISRASAMSRVVSLFTRLIPAGKENTGRGAAGMKTKKIFSHSPGRLAWARRIAPNCAECIGYKATNRLNPEPLAMSTSPRQTDMKYDVTGTWKLCAGDEQIAPQTIVLYALKLTSLVVVIFSIC